MMIAVEVADRDGKRRLAGAEGEPGALRNHELRRTSLRVS